MLDVVGRPLVRLMRSGRETGFVALTNILLVAQRRPQAFREHVRSFFIAAGDARFARKLKLQVLGAIVSRDTVNTMVPELASYAKSPRTDVSIGAINVIVKCARAVGETAMDCFRSLLLMLDDSRGDVLSAAMQAISVLLRDGTVRDAPMRQGSATLYDILCYLVRALDRLKSDQTRASVFGLVATFVESRFGTLHSLDVLRGAARSFKEEGELAKVQILELAVRIVVARKDPDIQSDSTTTMAAEDLRAYVFTLARYDVSFVVRDRARLLRALCPLGGDEDHTAEMPHVAELASEILVGAQALTARGSAALAKYRAPQHIVSSLSLVLDRPIGGYEALSDWPATKPVGVNRGGTQETGRVVGGRKQEHVGAGAPSAITIAGLSGRAKPFQQNTSDYSTPRSVGGDDLDAFLNSDSDPTTSPMISGRSAGFVHSERSLHRTAVVLRQAEIHSDDESDYSPSESESSALSSGEEDESESESGESGESEEEEEDTGDESEEDEDDSEDGSDDERNPFLPSDASAAITDNPFVSTGVPDRSPDEPAEFDADQHSNSQTKPLFEDTTKYWQ
ncbi:AP-3 complex subunit beta [Linderina macrospora]|uniref:AP-3 complex subunit beta n=1 Tax=Linderina macrospora TaxID=4868 RepID=A0ACC1JBJ5_9FUNG|nr:AP-3 complex subunit beta [Linderina macrospora]